MSHETPSHSGLQQSVFGSQEERVVGLPRSFLIWRRASLSCGLHSSESAVLKTRTMMTSTVMLKRAMLLGISILCDLICEKCG